MSDQDFTHAQLVAMENINRLKARYCRYVDTANADAMAELFVQDGELRDPASGTVWSGREAIRTAYGAMAAGAEYSAHHVVMPEITFHDDAHATAVWALNDYFSRLPGDQPDNELSAVRRGRGLGYYVDEVVRTGDGWRLKSVVIYWLKFETVSQISTELPAILAERVPA
jgi:uncharacterized protein (TIGR02246 family)